jgi:hypothetical protein
MSDTKSAATPLKEKYIGRLDSVGGVRREICRLYKEARRGTLGTTEASKLANILFIAGRLLEGQELEERIRKLEAAASSEPWK